MVKLTEYRKFLIRHIYKKILACEGGDLEICITDDGDYFIKYVPDIPPEFWCETCLQRARCKAKLHARWSGNTII